MVEGLVLVVIAKVVLEGMSFMAGTSCEGMKEEETAHKSFIIKETTFECR